MRRTVIYIDKSRKHFKNEEDFRLRLRQAKKKLKSAGVICDKIFVNHDLYMGTSDNSKIMKMLTYMRINKIDTFVVLSYDSLPLFTPYSKENKERILNYLKKRNIDICDYDSIEQCFLKE